MSRRIRSLKRKTATREPLPKLIVLCEGARTEPDYLKGYARSFRRLLVEFEVIRGAGVPVTMVERARTILKKIKKQAAKGGSFVEGDQVWVVFDRDDHPNFDQSVNLCSQTGIFCARSDPCFELWLILHFEDFDKLDDRKSVQKRLEKLWDGYDRRSGKSGNPKLLLDLVEQAEVRAEKQVERRLKEADDLCRPYTTVFSLTRAMRNLSIP